MCKYHFNQQCRTTRRILHSIDILNYPSRHTNNTPHNDCDVIRSAYLVVAPFKDGAVYSVLCHSNLCLALACHRKTFMAVGAKPIEISGVRFTSTYPVIGSIVVHLCTARVQLAGYSIVPPGPGGVHSLNQS